MSKIEIRKTTIDAANAAVKAKRAGRKNYTKGALARGLILAGKAVEEVAKIADTTVSSVYWYRSELRRMGAKLPAAE